MGRTCQLERQARRPKRVWPSPEPVTERKHPDWHCTTRLVTHRRSVTGLLHTGS